MTKKDKNKFVTNNEFNLTKNTDSVLMLFYVDWCKYSKNTITTWDEITNNITDNKYNNKYKISFKKIDCDKEQELATMYKIKEYPTIILVNNDKKYIYDANLSKDTLDLFIDTVLNK
jgi:thioredoxin-like negative regulator of GroEL